MCVKIHTKMYSEIAFIGLMFVSYEHVYGSFICLLSADIRELNANHVINSLLRMFNDNESS